MPELPEIETVKLQLEQVLVGQTNLKFEIRNAKTVRGNIDKISGRKVKSIERLGKVLIINFGEKLKLGFHFKMTGQLVFVGKKTRVAGGPARNASIRVAGGHPTKDFVGELPSKHTRVIFYFDNGILYFNDQRLFGWIELIDTKFKNQDSILNKYLQNLGPEPFDLTKEKFLKIYSKLKRPIKIALMDQKVISGVGNIYANDACWEAGIDPRVSVNQLTSDQLKLLFTKVLLVLREGIKYGGATAADDKYKNLHGMGGHYQDHFRVYGRSGKECLRNDGGIIKKVVMGGRGTYFCPVCQK